VLDEGTSAARKQEKGVTLREPVQSSHFPFTSVLLDVEPVGESQLEPLPFPLPLPLLFPLPLCFPLLLLLADLSWLVRFGEQKVFDFFVELFLLRVEFGEFLGRL
jgi:hypothetical protein